MVGAAAGVGALSPRQGHRASAEDAGLVDLGRKIQWHEGDACPRGRPGHRRLFARLPRQHRYDCNAALAHAETGFSELGFWCTIAMKHLVGLRSRALRPDRLWHDCIAAGGKPCQSPITGRAIIVRARRARTKLLRAATRVTSPMPRTVPT